MSKHEINNKNIKNNKLNQIHPILPSLPNIYDNNNEYKSTLKEGFSFSIGSSISNNIINKIFSSEKNNQVHSCSNNETISLPYIKNNKKSDTETDKLFTKYHNCINNSKNINEINDCLTILHK